MDCKIFTQKPEGFQATVEAAGCYCIVDHKFLFLRRCKEKPQGGTWGVPGGKIEKGETPKQGAIREVFEEVGIELNEKEVYEADPLYIRLPHVDYIYHRFVTKLAKFPKLNIALSEHDEAKWVTFDEALQLPLISGGKEALVDIQEKYL